MSDLLLRDIVVAPKEFWMPGYANQRVLLTKAEWEEYTTGVKQQLRHVPVFEISNVAEYFYDVTPQEEWDLFADFPKPIPPFEQCWMEWDVPRFTINDKGRRPLEMAEWVTRIGCFVGCDQPEELPDRYLRRVNMAPFCYTKQRRVMMMPIMIFALDHEFNPVEADPRQRRPLFAFPAVDFSKGLTTEETEDARTMGTSSCTLLYVALLALSLVNCRNVTMRQIKNKQRELTGSQRRRGIEQTADYHIIEIQPMKQVIKGETGEEGYSRAAATIVRGHFKDYSHGKGLFGKLKGQFWWEQRLTGSAAGIQYRLKSAVGDLDDAWKKGERKFIS